ncbi:MAG TPA: alpha/beta fold hydrolase [Gammaproteobacteria bacterium]|nr:alpha/beta fold hydrolase [Gammaproteobacteria bacterium]
MSGPGRASCGPARPPWGLGGSHVQTIIASSALPVAGDERRRSAALSAASTECILGLAGGVRLMGYHCPGTDAARGLVVLLHGWEGGAQSRYIVRVAATLREAGYATFRLNLRDHGGTHALNEELFHSCRIGEVVDAVAAIQARWDPQRLALVGYSLGGNFALRVGARASAAAVRIARIVAVCPVLHPPRTMHALETGFWAYRWYYLARWRRSLLAKQAVFPQRYKLGDLRRFRTLTATTEFFVREYTEFESLDGYLNGYSILGSALADLRAPARVIATIDDPIIPSADLEALAANGCIGLTAMPWGGHCGFVMDYKLRSCIDAMIVEELEETAGALP